MKKKKLSEIFFNTKLEYDSCHLSRKENAQITRIVTRDFQEKGYFSHKAKLKVVIIFPPVNPNI